MGLDMYLYINEYESEYSSGGCIMPLALQETAIKNGCFISKETHYKVAQWRKVNAIHRWFIENCADGDAEKTLSEIHVSEEDLLNLVGAISKVLNGHENNKELLPTQGGFFWGSTDYGEDYFEDLRKVKKDIENVLSVYRLHCKNGKPNQPNWDFAYRASW